MMILIADSGSTKTEWILLEKGSQEQRIRTAGLNPYFKSGEEILTEIRKVRQKFSKEEIDRVCFYGSGCAGEENKKTMAGLIRKVFPSVTPEVYSDLLGAARALFGNKEGIACILGTGSNACFYDGKDIQLQVPSLGFVMGDEGSGSYFGKQIVQDYYYGKLPEEIRAFLESETDMELSTVLNRLYKQEGGNAFIATFAEVLVHFSDHSYVKKLIRNGIEEFIKKQLRFLKDTGSQKVGMVGSIAYIHQEVIREVLDDFDYALEGIIQSPIEALGDYHLYKDLNGAAP